MSLSNYAEEKVLDHIFIGQESPWDLSSNDLYIGLATAQGTDGDTLSELTIGTDAYARVKIVDQTTNANNVFAAASNGSITTDTQITFPEATGNWGTITHIGIWDASTAGNLIAWGALSTSKLVESGDTFIITSGNLTVTLD